MRQVAEPSALRISGRDESHFEFWLGRSHQRRRAIFVSCPESFARQAVSFAWHEGAGQPAGSEESSVVASLTTS